MRWQMHFIAGFACAWTPAAAQTSLALAEAGRAGANGPTLSTAIVNARDLAQAHAYYGHLLGLKVSVHSRSWIQFETGDIRLALHNRRDRNTAEMHHTQPVSFGFTVENLEAWVEQARLRKIEFVSVPVDEGMGLTAEILDPEGNIVVVREPMSEESLEERLAEAWEDEVPHQTAMRSPVRKATRHSSWVALKPEYKQSKKSGKGRQEIPESEYEPEHKIGAPPAQPAARARKPATPPTDAQRARTQPATGRRRKSERVTLGTAKQEAARASKSKPVKRAAAKRVKPAAKKAPTKRRGKA